jgi:hypothetical protein
MGFLQQVMIKEQVMCEDMQNKIIKLEENVASLRRMADAASVDASILLPIVQHFHTRCMERGEYSEFINAVQYAIDDTGINVGEVVEALDRFGIAVDEDDFSKSYEVTIVVPVTVTVCVESTDPAAVHDLALDEIAWGALSAYNMDYDVHYESEVVKIEEV